MRGGVYLRVRIAGASGSVVWSRRSEGTEPPAAGVPVTQVTTAAVAVLSLPGVLQVLQPVSCPADRHCCQPRSRGFPEALSTPSLARRCEGVSLQQNLPSRRWNNCFQGGQVQQDLQSTELRR